MTKQQHEHQYLSISEPGTNDVHIPYWRCAHCDWHFLALGVLMLAVMAIYMLTLDLCMRPHSETPLLQENIGE